MVLHHEAQCFSFAMGHFDLPFTSITCNAPQIEPFTTNKTLWKNFLLAHLYIVQAHTFGQRYGPNCGAIGE